MPFWHLWLFSPKLKPSRDTPLPVHLRDWSGCSSWNWPVCGGGVYWESEDTWIWAGNGVVLHWILCYNFDVLLIFANWGMVLGPAWGMNILSDVVDGLTTSSYIVPCLLKGHGQSFPIWDKRWIHILISGFAGEQRAFRKIVTYFPQILRQWSHISYIVPILMVISDLPWQIIGSPSLSQIQFDQPCGLLLGMAMGLHPPGIATWSPSPWWEECPVQIPILAHEEEFSTMHFISIMMLLDHCWAKFENTSFLNATRKSKCKGSHEMSWWFFSIKVQFLVITFTRCFIKWLLRYNMMFCSCGLVKCLRRSF